MKIASLTLAILLMNAAMVVCIGCRSMPGHPQAEIGATRPEEVMDFHMLYGQNCSGCHGADGRGGAAIALNNPAYLAFAGENNLRIATAKGLSGTLMPAFARSAGGMLTDQQIDALIQGMLHTWGKPAEFQGQNIPNYASTRQGNASDGQKVYAAACARCHGETGTGVSNGEQGQGSTHSIVDSAYLTLVSDQSLRSIVVAGHPEKSAPDWRSYITGSGGHALTDQEITDVVAWIGAHRISNEPPPSSTAPAAKEAQ